MILENLINCIDYIELVNLEDLTGDVLDISYNSKLAKKNELSIVGPLKWQK
jgi:hypothetical protein